MRADGELVLVLDEALTARDLQAIDEAASIADFVPQALGPGGIRSRERAVIDDPSVSQLLWRRVHDLIPVPAVWAGRSSERVLVPDPDGWVFSGCNPRSRFYRYYPGAQFSPHIDEPWHPDENTRTLLTMLVYLSSPGCVGGETVVDGQVVQVQEGRVVIFEHGVLHEGKPVESGEKLVLRTDIIATRLQT